MRRIRVIRTYRNPIFLAREWAEAMKAGGFPSRRAFAKAIGVSQARVSQMLGLLEPGPRRSGYSMRSGIRTTHGRSQRGSSGRSPRFQKICNGPDSRSCWLLGDNANPAELSNVRIALRTVRYGHKMMCWIQR